MKTFKELNNTEIELNENIDGEIFNQIAMSLDVSIDIARMIVALTGVTGMVTLAAISDKLQTILQKKNPQLAKKFEDLAAGAAGGRR